MKERKRKDDGNRMKTLSDYLKKFGERTCVCVWGERKWGRKGEKEPEKMERCMKSMSGFRKEMKRCNGKRKWREQKTTNDKKSTKN